MKLYDSEDIDDKQIITDSLSVIENIIEIYPISTRYLCEKTKLLNCLIKKLKDPKKDFIKLFCSEILVSLIQGASENRISSSYNVQKSMSTSYKGIHVITLSCDAL